MNVNVILKSPSLRSLGENNRFSDLEEKNIFKYKNVQTFKKHKWVSVHLNMYKGFGW